MTTNDPHVVNGIHWKNVALANQEKVTELLDENELLTEQLESYKGFTNLIDDYFEYKCTSPEDQKYVHNVLGRLTAILKEILTPPTK